MSRSEIVTWKKLVENTGLDETEILDVSLTLPDAGNTRNSLDQQLLFRSMGKSAYVAAIGQVHTELPRYINGLKVEIGSGERSGSVLRGSIGIGRDVNYALVSDIEAQYAAKPTLADEMVPYRSSKGKNVRNPRLFIGDSIGYAAQTRVISRQNKSPLILLEAKRIIRPINGQEASLADVSYEDINLRLLKDFCTTLACHALVVNANIARYFGANNVMENASLKTVFRFSPRSGSGAGMDKENIGIGEDTLDNYLYGYTALKKQITEEIIEPIRYSRTMREFGVTPPQTLLLLGEPRTGKTTLAYAIAKVLGGELTTVNSTEIKGTPYVGDSEKKISKLFESIARRDGLQVLFIDELDGLMKSGNGGFDESLGKAFSTALDDLREKKKDVLVIAAANNEEVIPQHIRRSGRFDSRIYVELPGSKDLAQIFSKMMVSDIDGLFSNSYPFAEFGALAHQRQLNAADVRVIIDKLIRKRAIQKDIHGTFDTIADDEITTAIESFYH